LIFKKLKIFILSLSLLFSQSMWAFDVKDLSEKELSALNKLGLTNAEIEKLSTDDLKQKLQEKLTEEKENLKNLAQEKLQEIVDKKVDPKIEAVKRKIEQEKDELKKDATKLAAGYLTSTVSLYMATLVGVQMYMYCRSQPSAIIYMVSSGVYIFQEMTNMKVLRASQLAELEVVDDLGTDSAKSLKENAVILENKIDQQVGYLQAYKNTLDHAVRALKKKASNAKIVSVGFLAASGVAAAEQLNFFTGVSGSCVASNSTPKQINFSKELDQRYVRLIESAPSAADKWGLYYEWESLKFGVDRSITKSEYDKLKKSPVDTSILKSAINFISSQLLTQAFAAESKKVTMVESLKDNKAADWIGDLDKLGIVGGAATALIAYMAGWQIGFFTSVKASGTTRAIVFGVQGALALTAGILFDNAADNLGKKLEKIDNLINQTKELAVKGINILVPSDSDAKNLQKLGSKLGIPSDKLISEMPINQAKEYLQQIKEKAKTLDDEAKNWLNGYEDKLQGQLDVKKSELTGKYEDKKVEVTTKLDEAKADLQAKVAAKKIELETKIGAKKIELQTQFEQKKLELEQKILS
ncbi:MAG: hypothetical protein K2Q18_06040, partial [Bdellovibrionales bacterium]|nr:hypothetical protein [Bdellovibrionales bacterium]